MNNNSIQKFSLVLLISTCFLFVGCSSKSESVTNTTPNKDVFNTITELDENIIKGTSKDEKEKTPSTSGNEITSSNPKNKDEIPPATNSSTEESIPSTSKVEANSLDNTKIAWWFKPNKQHITPEINLKIGFDLNKYDSHYVGDTSRKVLYLTFDEGYENGYTAKILDTLKENDVKAIFFVTSPYLKSNPDLIKRMVSEGHIVGNHTNHHPSMPDVTGTDEKFNNEFSDVETKYKEIIGTDIPNYFRPPMGEYSEKSLAMTKNLGYKTVFWSFAYHDWDINKQPDPVKAKETIMNGLHNGSIMLIHAVSKTNTEILDSVLKEAKAQGYVFELLP
ncbi:MAG: delta-lactam-biosynthetic de-N-acetylase [Clostridium sp.]|uniref:delta-lactam-biosynthetic de-N-acetylase n=1 Tax=Clostridium sp. TaxID=1506 RepID=UPI00305D9A20